MRLISANPQDQTEEDGPQPEEGRAGEEEFLLVGGAGVEQEDQASLGCLS